MSFIFFIKSDNINVFNFYPFIFYSFCFIYLSCQVFMIRKGKLCPRNHLSRCINVKEFRRILRAWIALIFKVGGAYGNIYATRYSL